MSASTSSQCRYNNRLRTTHLVFQYPDSPGKILQYQNERTLRSDREEKRPQTFTCEWNIKPSVTTGAGYNAVNDICDSFNFWCKNSSINCAKCNSIVYQKLPPNFMKKIPVKSTRDCVCCSNRYVVPHFNSIPEPLRQLTKEDVWTLRPFDLDCGVYERESHGYGVKTGMIALIACNIPIEQEIESIVNASDRQKCFHAYQYLMNSEDSCYSHFVLLLVIDRSSESESDRLLRYR